MPRQQQHPLARVLDVGPGIHCDDEAWATVFAYQPVEPDEVPRSHRRGHMLATDVVHRLSEVCFGTAFGSGAGGVESSSSSFDSGGAGLCRWNVFEIVAIR